MKTKTIYTICHAGSELSDGTNEIWQCQNLRECIRTCLYFMKHYKGWFHVIAEKDEESEFVLFSNRSRPAVFALSRSLMRHLPFKPYTRSYFKDGDLLDGLLEAEVDIYVELCNCGMHTDAFEMDVDARYRAGTLPPALYETIKNAASTPVTAPVTSAASP